MEESDKAVYPCTNQTVVFASWAGPQLALCFLLTFSRSNPVDYEGCVRLGCPFAGDSNSFLGLFLGNSRSTSTVPICAPWRSILPGSEPLGLLQAWTDKPFRGGFSKEGLLSPLGLLDNPPGRAFAGIVLDWNGVHEDGRTMGLGKRARHSGNTQDEHAQASLLFKLVPTARLVRSCTLRGQDFAADERACDERDLGMLSEGEPKGYEERQWGAAADWCRRTKEGERDWDGETKEWR